MPTSSCPILFHSPALHLIILLRSQDHVTLSRMLAWRRKVEIPRYARASPSISAHSFSRAHIDPLKLKGESGSSADSGEHGQEFACVTSFLHTNSRTSGLRADQVQQMVYNCFQQLKKEVLKKDGNSPLKAHREGERVVWYSWR